MKSALITLEGGEGSGKSTQIGRLREALVQQGFDVLLTREPGGSYGAEMLRSLLVKGDAGRWDGMSEALLLNAARRDHLEKTIKPALSAGKIVISDRFADSTIAYQGYGHGIDLAALAELQRLAIGDLEPDLTLILDMPVEEGLERARSRGYSETRYEEMDLAFHHRLCGGFLTIAAADPDRCKVIDANRTIEDVHNELLAAVAALFERKA